MYTKRYTALGIIIGLLMVVLVACQAFGTPTPATPVVEEQAQSAPAATEEPVLNWIEEDGHAVVGDTSTPRFTAWVYEFIRDSQSAKELVSHSSGTSQWWQANMVGNTKWVGLDYVSWAEWATDGLTMKDIDNLEKDESFFVAMRNKHDWVDSDKVIQMECVGTFIPSYDPAIMADWDVSMSTIIQFDGDASKFVEDMSLAWAKIRADLNGCPTPSKNQR